MRIVDKTELTSSISNKVYTTYLADYRYEQNCTKPNFVGQCNR